MIFRYLAGTGCESGQTLIEYALMLVLLALVVIGMLTATGVNLTGTYSYINSNVTNAAGS